MVVNNASDFYSFIEFVCQESETVFFSQLKQVNDSTDLVFGDVRASVCLYRDKNHSRLYMYEVKTDNSEKCRFIFGPASILFSVQFQKFREELAEKHTVKGIISHNNISSKSYHFPVAFILLDRANKKTWFANTDTIDQIVGLFQDNLETVNVYTTDEIDPKNLAPDYYNNGDIAVINEAFQGCTVVKLRDVAEIIGGKGVKESDYHNKGIPYLRGRDIQAGRIIRPEVCIDPHKAKEFARQLVQDGDILLTKFFGQNKIARVSTNDVPAIISNGLIAIRPFGVAEGYLYRYLTSKTGSMVFQKQLQRIQKGATISSITLRDVSELDIPIYDEETMQVIENLDTIGRKELKDAAISLSRSIETEEDIEERVKKAFLDAGWNLRQVREQHSGDKYSPDFLLKLQDGRTVYVEIKTKILNVSQKWADWVAHILSGEEHCFFIITTGMYYEVHSAKIQNPLRLTHTPSELELLSWEKEAG